MYITFNNFLNWLERPFQTTVSRERDYLVDQANKVRQILYDLYAKYHLEIDVTECFEVQKFNSCEVCMNISGITLPPYMETIEGAFHQAAPVRLYTKWRELKTGLKTSDDCKLASYDIPGKYCTERDVLIPEGECSVMLQLFATSNADAGKEVRVRYLAIDETVHDELVVLGSGTAKRLSTHAVAMDSVILPSGLSGIVRLEQSDGRVLSEYAPWEQVPSYRRVKVTGVCEGSVIAVIASRRFTPLYSDTDIAEIDDRVIVEHLGRHLFYAESGSERDMIRKSEFHLNKVIQLLQSKSGRELGNRHDSFRGPPARRSRLWLNRR